MQGIRPAIGDALVAHGELALFELLHERPEIRFLYAERAADGRLWLPRIAIDDHEHAEDGGPQVELAKRSDEIGESDDLRPAQRVADIARQRAKFNRGRGPVARAIPGMARPRLRTRARRGTWLRSGFPRSWHVIHSC